MLSSAGDIKRAKIGQITANGTTPVSIQVRGLQADSYVAHQVNTISGTIGGMFVSTKTPATNSNSMGTLQFTSTAGNTSVYDIYVFV